MFKIDAWLIGRFERFSHWTQRVFGLGSATWERLSAVIAIFYYAQIVHLDFLCAVTVLFLGIRFARSFKHHESTGAEATANPMKLRDRTPRLLLLTVAVMFSGPSLWITHNPWFEFSVISAYFAACDDLPPGESKVRSWIRSLRASLSSPKPVHARTSHDF